jgi:hypothetical protein
MKRMLGGRPSAAAASGKKTCQTMATIASAVTVERSHGERG